MTAKPSTPEELEMLVRQLQEAEITINEFIPLLNQHYISKLPGKKLLITTETAHEQIAILAYNQALDESIKRIEEQ